MFLKTIKSDAKDIIIFVNYIEIMYLCAVFVGNNLVN